MGVHKTLQAKHTGFVPAKHTGFVPVKHTGFVPVKHSAAVQLAQPAKHTPVERVKALRRAAGQDLVIEAARAELDSARQAYFKVLDCYSTSHSLCTAVSVPAVAQLVQGAAAPVNATVDAPAPGSKDMVLLMAFVAASVLGCCRPLPLGAELPRKLEPVATPA